MAARSIRALLLGGTVAALLAVLGAVAWLSFSGSQEEAEELFDARLATSARVLEALVAHQVEKATIAAPIVIALPGPLESVGHDTPGPLGHYYETKIAFQVRDAGGRLLARSASAPDAPFAPLSAGFSTRPFDGSDWRVFSLRSGEVWIQVAERDDVRGELSEKLAFASAAPILAGTPLLLALLALLIRYGLAPLSALARQIAARQPGSVAPLTLARTPREIAPLLLLYRGSRTLMAIGYLLVWAAIGLLPYALMDWTMMFERTRAVVVLAAAGAYELTPFKHACLRHCQSPATFLMQRFDAGPLRLGVEHAVWCTGCCVGLMAVLVFAASMNLVWAAAIAGVVFVQKALPFGSRSLWATGAALLAAAVIVAVGT